MGRTYDVRYVNVTSLAAIWIIHWHALYGVYIIAYHPRWLGRWSACLSRSISWVQVPPSACLQGLFLAKNNDKEAEKILIKRKARERELAIFHEHQRAVGVLSPMRDKK